MLTQSIKPMLLHKADTPPVGDHYWHQLKWDGHRCLLHYVRGKGVTLFTRHETNCTAQYPELQIDLGPKIENAILDGEMVCFENGKPSFEDVMARFLAKKQSTIARLSKSMPAHFVCFDLLYLNGVQVTDQTLEERYALLRDFLTESDVLTLCPTHEDGTALFAAASDLGLEGIVSKRKDSRYAMDTRSQHWLKVKNYQYGTFEIAGMRKGEFGWILQQDGVYKGVLEFVPGFARRAFWQVAREIVIEETPSETLVKPVFRCKVKYQCLTKKGLLRSPSFVEFDFV